MFADTGDQNVNGKAITVLSDAANRNTRIFFSYLAVSHGS